MFTRIITSVCVGVLLTILCVVVYLQRDDFTRGVKNIYTRVESLVYPPCSRPIYYHIGEFSDQFNISQEQFIKALAEAEKIWEDTIDKDLFSYHGDGALAINLMYDHRQEVTNALKVLDSSLDRSRATYDALKLQYQQKYSAYEQMQQNFEARVRNYEAQKGDYEQQVNKLNKRGGANDTQYARLEQIRQELNQTAVALRVEQAKLQKLGQEVNNLASGLNERARELNLVVDAYNTTGGTVGEEFDEGVYRIDDSGRAIDVFQFESYEQLVRLLAHEFGHALGIDHIDDPNAVMYHLNRPVAAVLAPSDISALRALCQLR